MLTQAPKGTKDILPSEVYKWQYLESVFSKLCRNFGYKEIRMPVFEHTELFKRGVGDGTDIVQKEMYTFLDKGERSLTLRPEGTAGVVRSYIEHGFSSLPQPLKLYYNITAYRYEKMQKGRYREFHQFGVEAFGAKGPSVDVEIISMLSMFFNTLGLKEIMLNINSIGCSSCRGVYDDIIKLYFKNHLDNLCETCKTRYEKNPLRILDCKEESCKKYTKDAPSFLDHLCDECNVHFDGVKLGLDNLGIKYNIDKNIVRGLDYYTKTVFEFISSHIGSQGTICGGGRYDGLIETCGGTSTPGIGFATGVERILLVMESQGITFPKEPDVDIYIVTIGNDASKFGENLLFNLRNEGISGEKDLMGRSLKSQMKHADKIGAKYSIVIGDNEINNNTAVLKNMKTGEQKEIMLKLLIEEIKK